MQKLPNAQLTHVGVYVRDLDGMIDFYVQTLGMVVSDRGDHPLGGKIAFLTRTTQEHHQLVLASGLPAEEKFNRINQISFRVATLDDLRTFDGILRERGIAVLRTANHGNAWSIYFFDPEGNKVEIYTPSDWYVAQPFGVPVDFEKKDEVIFAETQELIRDNATRTSRLAWEEKMGKRLG